MFRNPIIDAAVVLLVVILFFGPKRLPELGKGLGEGIRGFKEGIGGRSSDDEKAKLPAAESQAAPRETVDARSEHS
jgi:sec-independent protein translocase protein TatA